MTVKELIEKLSKKDQDLEVEIKICGPNDSAWTRQLRDVKFNKEDNVVRIDGWAGSDDETAFFPSESDY